jgi:hypothetical protein
MVFIAKERFHMEEELKMAFLILAPTQSRSRSFIFVTRKRVQRRGRLGKLITGELYHSRTSWTGHHLAEMDHHNGSDRWDILHRVPKHVCACFSLFANAASLIFSRVPMPTC